LIAILAFVAIFKLLGFGASIHHAVSSPAPYVFAGLAVSGFFLGVHLLGLIAAVRERTCGLKVFSLVQTILVFVCLVGFAFFLWNNAEALLHRNKTSGGEGEPITLNPYEEGQDIFNDDKQKDIQQQFDTSKKGCRFSKIMPFVVMGISVLISALDLVSAVLAWRGYQQLVAADNAIETFSYLSEANDNDNEIPMTMPGQPQPLNVVYVPANLYDPLQTGQVYQ